MNEIKNLEAFLRDASHFIFSLSQVSKRFKDDFSIEAVHEGFRYAHSLKSEASYLGFKDLTQVSEELENLFGLLRENQEKSVEGLFVEDIPREISEEDIKKLDDLISRSRLLFTEIERKDRDMSNFSIPHETVEDSVKSEQMEVLEDDSSGLLFSDFEQKLIEEAALRRETLYRLICNIDAEPEMMYPRAYLIVNNLEQKVNLIKTRPFFSEENDFSEFILYFSSAVSEKVIYKAINVDQISRSELIKIEYKMLLNDYPLSILPESSNNSGYKTESFVNIKVSELDEITAYIGDLRVLSARMKDNVIGHDSLLFQKLIEGIEDRLKTIRTVSIKEMVNRFPDYVKELSRKLGKDVELKLNYDDDLILDRYVLDILSDTLMHLIRNAIDHGIESSVVREEKGKDSAGLITFSCKKANNNLYVTLEDNGRGVVLNQIQEEANKREMNADQDLLGLLSHPGFSTLSEVGDISGRGVGLDLVVHNIRQLLNGDIKIENNSGEGLKVFITIPSGDSVLDLTVFQSGKLTCSMPSRNIQKTLLFDPSCLLQMDDGTMSYTDEGESLPLYSVSGRLSHCRDFKVKSELILVSDMNSRAFIIVDELLIERKVLVKSFSLGEEVQPFLYTLLLNSRKADFLYLSPSLIL